MLSANSKKAIIFDGLFFTAMKIRTLKFYTWNSGLIALVYYAILRFG